MKLKNCLSMTLSLLVLFSYIHNIKADCKIPECNNVSDSEVFNIMLNFIPKRPDRTYKENGDYTAHTYIADAFWSGLSNFISEVKYKIQIKDMLQGTPESDYNLDELTNEFMNASVTIQPLYCYRQGIRPDHCGKNICDGDCICRQKTFKFSKNWKGEDGTFEVDCNYMVDDFKQIKKSFLQKLQDKCNNDCKDKRKQIFNEFVEEHRKDLGSRRRKFMSQQVADVKAYGSNINEYIKKKVIEYYDSENKKYTKYLEESYDDEIDQLTRKQKDYFNDVDSLPLSENLTVDKKNQMKTEYKDKTDSLIKEIRDTKKENMDSSKKTKNTFEGELDKSIKNKLEDIEYKDKTKKEKVESIIKHYKSTIDKTINDSKIELQNEKQKRDNNEKEDKEQLEKELEKFKEYDRLLKLEKEKFDKLTEEEKERLKEKEEFQKKLKEFEEQNKRGFITDPNVINSLILNQRKEVIYNDGDTVQFCNQWKLEYDKLKILNEKAKKFNELDVKVQCEKFNKLKLHKNVDLSKPLDNLSTEKMGYREDVTVYYCDGENQRLEGKDCIKIYVHICNDWYCKEWDPGAVCWGGCTWPKWWKCGWDSCKHRTGWWTRSGGECTNSRVKRVYGDGWSYVKSNSVGAALVDWGGGWNGNYSGRCVKTERTPAKSRTIYKYHINLPDIGLKRDIKLEKSYDPNFTVFR